MVVQSTRSLDGLWGMRVSGVMVSYYFICPTKLWLFSHNIAFEWEDENVEVGRALHEERYKRDSKDVFIDHVISVDFIRQGDVLVLHEIKKARKMENAHRWQMLYYLYYLKQRGISAKGEINYPLLSKRVEVVLSREEEAAMEGVLQDIQGIVFGKMPSPRRQRICPRCAYFEFCFGDEAFPQEEA